jgi:hypothetical protein
LCQLFKEGDKFHAEHESTDRCELRDLDPDMVDVEVLDVTEEEARKLLLTTPAFLTSGDFLIDMGGHELMGALAAPFRGVGAPPAFTDSFLGEELLRVLPPIYQLGTIYQPDDFHELAAILRQY